MPISALIGLAGSLLGSELQHQKNRENFDYMQQVNSPAAQIARFRQAGINPAMMMLNPSVSSGNATSPPDNVDYAAHINNGINAALSSMQMRNLASQNRNLEEEIEGKRIANDVARVVGEADKVEAEDRKQDALSNIKLKNRVGSPPDGEGWFFNDEKNVWSRQNPDSMEVETLLPGTVRDDIIRSRIGRELDEGRLVNLNYLLNKFEYSLKEKFGEKLTNAQLNQAYAIIRNATLNGDLMKIDVDTFKKLGIGPNVIRALVSTAQAFGGQLNGLIGATELLLK